ncbi:MAG: outer membrane protein assembly factor BamE [Gammaproteobacteria bacterium]|nr:outer membrane protein assembly factor BamE [Gammaproteobacteria bacterium]
MKRLRTILCVLCCVTALSGCDKGLLTIYKIDVQQGNALLAEDVEKIQVGMGKEQVLFVLGSPLIVDSFHPDRWDYVYLLKPGYGPIQRKQLTLIFDRDELIEMIRRIPDSAEVLEDDSAPGG